MALTVWAQNDRPFISAEKLFITVITNKKKKCFNIPGEPAAFS